MTDRARITIPDVVFVVVSIGMIAVLWPVLRDRLAANADVIATPTAWLFLLILPMALLVLISVIFKTAAAGVVR